jgi:hypothetical protein
MRDDARIQDLKSQRAALEARIGVARRNAASSRMIRQMERALAALDDLIAREEARES